GQHQLPGPGRGEDERGHHPAAPERRRRPGGLQVRLPEKGLAMPLWYRVFGTSDVQPAPAALLEHLNVPGRTVAGHFRGDDLGWFGAELVYAEDAPPLELQRYLAGEDGIRGELNGWAAWLETREENPNHGPLMGRVIGTKQLFTLPLPGEEVGDSLAE